MSDDADLQKIIDSLSTKLAGLDLDDDERSVLMGALMTGDGVEGYAYDLNPNDLSVLDESVTEIDRFRTVIGGSLAGTFDISTLPSRFRC